MEITDTLLLDEVSEYVRRIAEEPWAITSTRVPNTQNFSLSPTNPRDSYPTTKSASSGAGGPLTLGSLIQSGNVVRVLTRHQGNQLYPQEIEPYHLRMQVVLNSIVGNRGAPPGAGCTI